MYVYVCACVCAYVSYDNPHLLKKVKKRHSASSFRNCRSSVPDQMCLDSPRTCSACGNDVG